MKTPKQNKKLTTLLKKAFYDLPTPLNLSTQWNVGSLLGLCLTIQIISGLLLTMHYTPNSEYAFQSIVHITRDVNFGWLLRSTHATGASFFFLCAYIHVGRGLYFGSYKYTKVWLTGTMLLLTLMATAFLGYVLPWGQMSYWGATVITNLLSIIPELGDPLIQWIWGGFTVSNATLNRFFVLHFSLPFLMLGLTAIHLIFLHETGSNNPLGLSSNTSLIPFHPFYTAKDTVGVLVILMCLICTLTFSPFLFSDPQNFIEANPMTTPLHIQPEWYFLFAYAILRATPNKVGGVIAMLLAILLPLTMPTLYPNKMRSTAFYPPSKLLFWSMTSCFILLTWLGHMPTEQPMMWLGQMVTTFYFLSILMLPVASIIWDKIIFMHYNH
uniref:Cytochrome b n=1 Tax=Chamberlainia hainesiana TaxID=1264661 RepID=A0A513X0B6_9BIVA|nr:cytochrome b [Chamberlainia hainesiana]